MNRAMSTTETTTAPVELQKGHIGQSIPRKEDRRLVQGQGIFFDDVRRHGMGTSTSSAPRTPTPRSSPSTSPRRSRSTVSTGR